jgi:hypothetical protein
MSSKIILTMLATVMLAFMTPSAAQKPKEVPRIGYLTADSRSARSDVRAEAFGQGLRELGYVRGKKHYH